MYTLKGVKCGDTASVIELHGEGTVRHRTVNMGAAGGAEVYVRKVAPLGDPMEVNVRGYELSLRRMDAEMIEV